MRKDKKKQKTTMKYSTNTASVQWKLTSPVDVEVVDGRYQV